MIKLRIAALTILVLGALAAGTLGARWFTGLRGQPAEEAAQLDPTAPSGISLTAMSTDAIIANLQNYLKNRTSDKIAYGNLGIAYLQKARETGDPAFYSKADGALQRAVELDPNDYRALTGLGALALARHQFREALGFGQRAQPLNPYNAGIYGVIGDAQLELGDYPEAFSTFDHMTELRPDLTSYARISYARELKGDLPGAIEAMQRAVAAGAPHSEALAWAQAQLGNLYFNQADYSNAERAYQEALASWDNYAYARAGIANIRAASGDYQTASDIYARLVNTMPLPQFVIALGDIYAAAGRSDDAAREYDLVDIEEKLFQANGVDVDAELALFDADHGRDLSAVLGRAQAAYARRPSLTVADILAWTLYQTGDYTEAQRMMQQALRLGTRSALMYYHAGMIAFRLHDYASAADYLDRALTLNPHFSLLYATPARQLLGDLQAGNPGNVQSLGEER